MKNIFFLIILIFVSKMSFGQQASATATKSDFAVIEWAEQNHDFGKIKQGEPATFEFKFTNTGAVPLILTSANPSCGCTTPDWTKTPVMPGQKGFVKATFNAASPGGFNKTITVTANVEQGSIPLIIRGEVMPTVQ